MQILCQLEHDNNVEIPNLHQSISGAESLSLLCEVLSALGNTKPGVLKPILPDICHAMASVAQSSLDGSDDDLMDGKGRREGGDAAKTRVLTLLAAMLFQTLKGHRWTPDAEQARQPCL